MNDLVISVVTALSVAGLVSLVARRAGALTVGGAIAATLVGGAAYLAGWDWAGLLLVFFISGSVLSKLPDRAGTESIVAKGGGRDAVQVIANGGVFCAMAIVFFTTQDFVPAVAGAGALAAACADTWATEIGTRFGGTPRHTLTWKRVPAGTSGAVSAAGLLGSVAGATLIAGTAANLAFGAFAPLAIGGVVGALADTVIGATIQERRWCETCGLATERDVHTCGTPTRVRGGIRRLDNDVVNAFATIVGGGVATLLA